MDAVAVLVLRVCVRRGSSSNVWRPDAEDPQRQLEHVPGVSGLFRQTFLLLLLLLHSVHPEHSHGAGKMELQLHLLSS